jgi:hypothetical protein
MSCACIWPRECLVRYGIDLSVDGPALQAVAELAAQQGTGARGLLTVRLPRPIRNHSCLFLSGAASKEREKKRKEKNDQRCWIRCVLPYPYLNSGVIFLWFLWGSIGAGVGLRAARLQV